MMRKHKPRVGTVILASVLLMVLSVVGGQAAPTVRMSLWTGEPEVLPVFKHAAEVYQRAHPNVEVTVLATEPRDHEAKLAATMPSDTAGDIVTTHDTVMNRYIVAGLIPKVPPDIAQFVRSRSFHAAALPSVTFQNEVYCVPWITGRGQLFYNTNMLRQAGLSRPPRTMNELRAYAKKLTKYDSRGRVIRSGFSFRLFGAGSGVAEKFAMMMWPRGGEILTRTAQGKYKAGYDNEAGRATLKMYIDGLHRDKIDSLDIKHDAEAFAVGQTAMFQRESWVIGFLAKDAPNLKYMVGYMPRDKRAGTFFLTFVMCVTRSSKNPETAWDFVKTLMQPQFQREILEKSGWLPPRRDVDYSPVVTRMPQFKAFLENPADYALWTMPMLPNFDEIETKLASRLVAAFRDRRLLNASVLARTLHEAAEETNSILKRDGLYGE